MKRIIVPVLATLSISIFASLLFFNSILGVFGLAATSIESLKDLRASHQVTQAMKERHKIKKTKLTNKLSKKSKKRVASSAIAIIPVVGVVASIVAVTAIEVSNYCEEKKELQLDENILFGTNHIVDTDVCMKEMRADAESTIDEITTSTISNIVAFSDSAKLYSTSKYLSAKNSTRQLWDQAVLWASE